MDLTDRFGFLLLGGLIGFALGYLVAYLRSIKEEVHEVDEIMKKFIKHDEGGYAVFETVRNMALLLVIVVTVWAAFASQSASNTVKENQQDVADTQTSLSRISVCTQQYLSKTITALNERTTYSQAQAAANVKLQKAQAEYLQIILVVPPPSSSDARKALSKYFDALTEFVTLSEKTQTQQAQNPYPTNEELMDCLSGSSVADVQGESSE